MRFAGLWCRENKEDDQTNWPGNTQLTLFGPDPDLEKLNVTKLRKLDVFFGLAVVSASAALIECHVIA